MTQHQPQIIPAKGSTLEAEKLTNLRQKSGVLIFDTIQEQLKELVKCQNPKVNFKENPDKYQHLIEDYLSGKPVDEIGNWVFYPWRNTLVHLLGPDEFAEIRSNRNKYKITHQEQETLSQKAVGVVGLSVGQTVAITMAMEGLFGEIRLADFDEIELSNLNRIRTGVYNLGQNKAISVAREILEINPYVTVQVYSEGLTDENIDSFFTQGRTLDVLVEECDGLDIKVLARQKAKDLGIPVVMETNDRAMLDIERFDQEPNRPILHGLVKTLDIDVLKSLKTNEDKVPYMLDMIGIEDTSVLLRASMLEIEQSLTTWPQLASSVTFGGGLVCDSVRRILLGEDVQSGRFYHDIEANVVRQAEITPPEETPTNSPLEWDTMKQLAAEGKWEAIDHIPNDVVEELVALAHTAPSRGNMQPWKWYYNSGLLYLAMDGLWANPDFGHLETMVAFGAAIENLIIAASVRQIQVTYEYVFENDSPIAAVCTFKTDEHIVGDRFNPYLETRGTNRMLGDLVPIDPSHFQLMEKATQEIEGADLHWIDNKEGLGEILASVERMRVMTERGHQDFVEEIRWTAEEAETTKDGVDLRTVDLTETEKAGLVVAKDYNVVKQLREWNLGTGFETMMNNSIENTERIGFISMKGDSRQDYFEGGRALERAWLAATQFDLGFHPISPSTFIFAKLMMQGDPDQFSPFTDELHSLRKRFVEILGIEEGVGHIFLFRLFKGKDIQVRSLRRNLTDHLFLEKAK